jgi:hypothetical protein
MEALEDLYLATDGDNWDCEDRPGNPWVFSETANPCEDDWIGVTCNSDTTHQVYHITNITLGGCSLVGTIPRSVGRLTKMAALSLPFNYLHGHIPDVFGELPDLSLLSVWKNMLEGSLPPSMALLPKITAIYLSDNRLSGHVHLAFNSSVQTQLYAIDVSNNDFSGSLPEGFFSSSALEYFYLSFNCFSGSIPEAVCSATGLIELGMHCLACSPRCTTKLAKTGSFIVSNPVDGTIPPCMFSLPNLKYLNLNWNYLTGTLPVDYPSIVSGQLSDVFLSFNVLTGTIPASLWSSLHHSGTLALQNNRLTGGLPASRAAFGTPSWDIDLTNNRLSGPASGANWPKSVDIDIVTGNMFGCDNGDHSRLPQNDYEFDNYVCGSDNFNVPIIVWVCVAVGLALLLSCVWYWRDKLDSYMGIMHLTGWVVQWGVVLQCRHVIVNLPSLLRVRDVVILLNTVAVALAVGVVCVLAPAYAWLKASYGTYTHQYAWVLSAVLLSGKTPFAVCFVMFLLVLCVSVGALFVGHNRLVIPELSGRRLLTHETSQPRIIAASLLYMAVNFGVVGIVNISFVSASTYMVAEYQLGVSAFKVGWNLLVAPLFSRWLAYELSAGRADWFTLELFVSLMNNIGIPLLAVLIVSPQCLSHLLGVGFFLDANSGKVYVFDDRIDPFYYGYQCSYVYMDFYAAAFVYASLMTSFGMPLLEQLALQLHQRLPRGWILFRCIDIVLPRIVKPTETDPERIPDCNILRPFFDTTQFLVTQLTSLALVLTMGVVFPPLAVPVAVTMVLSAVYVMLKVGRLLTNASEEKQQKYVEIIEQECANVATPTTMRRAFWMLLWFGCWFYTLFLFDILGDKVGFYKAYWVIIVVPLLPLVAVIVCIEFPYWGLDLTGMWMSVPQDEPAVMERDSVDTPLLSL